MQDESIGQASLPSSPQPFHSPRTAQSTPSDHQQIAELKVECPVSGIKATNIEVTDSADLSHIDRVILEIVETERTYVRDLHEIIEVTDVC